MLNYVNLNDVFYDERPEPGVAPPSQTETG